MDDYLKSVSGAKLVTRNPIKGIRQKSAHAIAFCEFTSLTLTRDYVRVVQVSNVPQSF